MQKFTGKEYLYISIANCFGMDKFEWDERINWAKSNLPSLDPKNAESACMAYAAMQALQDTEAGKPTGYAVGLDACCSGMQWLSVLVHDENAARLTNIIDTGVRMDAYTSIYEAMREQQSIGHITRADSKAAVMQSLYGGIKTPQALMGDYYELFIDVMEKQVPRAWALNKLFLQIWDPIATEYSWTMPDGFDVLVPVEVTTEHRFNFYGKDYTYLKKTIGTREVGRSLSANVTHSVDSLAVREMVRRCSYDPVLVNRAMEALAGSTNVRGTKKEYQLAERLAKLYKETGFLSARVISCLNYHTVKMFPEKELLSLMKSLPKKRFDLRTVHDEFYSLGSYCNDMREQYKNIIVEVAKSNLLSHVVQSICSEPLIKDVEITDKIGCNYAIC